MPTILDMGKELDQKRGELAELFKKHERIVDGKKTYDMDVGVIEQINTRNDELNSLQDNYDAAFKAEQIALKNAEEHEKRSKIRRPEFSGDPESSGDRKATGRGPEA